MRAAARLLPLLLALAGCATAPLPTPPPCPPGQDAIRAELFFGRGLAGGGEVSEAQWQAFLDDTVTPAFPDGLSVLDAAGQWRGGRERSKLLLLLLPGESRAGAAARLAPLAEAWKARFAQQSVLVALGPACASF